MSAIEWLVGKHLPPIFAKHFGEVATPRRSDGSCDTPYVRFVLAALPEVGIFNNGKAYAPETIARALSYAKKPRMR